MHIVVWNDHEGNEQQRVFDHREGAEREAAALREKFDHVAILLETEV